MSKERRKLKKRKAREATAKKRVFKRRQDIREMAKLEREADRLQWENRDKTPPPIIKHEEE